MERIGAIALICALGLAAPSEVFAGPSAASGRQDNRFQALIAPGRTGAASTQTTASSLRLGDRQPLEREKTVAPQSRIRALGTALRGAARAALPDRKASTEAATGGPRPSSPQRGAVAQTVVRNAKHVIEDVDRRTGAPGVEVFLWSAKGQPFGHAGVAVRVPGEDKLRVFDVTGNKSGELVVREFASREQYLYGSSPSNATNREVYSARLTNLSPAEHAEIGKIATSFRSLAERSESGSAHYRLFLGEGHSVLQRMLVPLERRVIPLQEGFASKGELGNCARCTSRALTAGGVAPPGREASTPAQLFNRFVEHHAAQDPSRLHIVDWKQASGVPTQPREHIKQGSVPAPHFVVAIDARTQTASVSEAGPHYKRVYQTRKGPAGAGAGAP